MSAGGLQTEGDQKAHGMCDARQSGRGVRNWWWNLSSSFRNWSEKEVLKACAVVPCSFSSVRMHSCT